MQRITSHNRPLDRVHAPEREEHKRTLKPLVVETVKRALRAVGASSVVVDIYDQLAADTDHRAWVEGGRPVCYREQLALARDVGLSDRHYRRIEHWLEQFGALRRETADNGYRGRRRTEEDGYVELGLSLAPSLENLALFQSMIDNAKARQRRCDEHRFRARAMRQAIRNLLNALPDAERGRWERMLDEADAILPARRRASATEDELVGYRSALAEVEALVAAAVEARLALTEPVDCVPNELQMSGAPDMDVRCHIQPTTGTLNVCNAQTASDMPADKSAEALNVRSAKADKDCLENKHKGSAGASRITFTPRQLYWMASEDMRMYIDAAREPDEPLTDRHFIDAAKTILPALGVHPSAWAEAIDIMGTAAASLCVLVIDANRFRETAPVRKPGAMLRAMARLAKSGSLNLHASLIGLRNWKLATHPEDPTARH